MADTFQILNGADVSWGTEDVTEGTVLDSSVEDTAQFEKIENKQGAVVGVVIFDTETVVTAEVLAGAAAVKPEMGTEITIDGVAAFVMKSAYKRGNKTTRKISITANKWTNCAPEATP